MRKWLEEMTKKVNQCLDHDIDVDEANEACRAVSCELVPATRDLIGLLIKEVERLRGEQAMDDARDEESLEDRVAALEAADSKLRRDHDWLAGQVISMAGNVAALEAKQQKPDLLSTLPTFPNVDEQPASKGDGITIDDVLEAVRKANTASRVAAFPNVADGCEVQSAAASAAAEINTTATECKYHCPICGHWMPLWGPEMGEPTMCSTCRESGRKPAKQQDIDPVAERFRAIKEAEATTAEPRQPRTWWAALHNNSNDQFGGPVVVGNLWNQPFSDTIEVREIIRDVDGNEVQSHYVCEWAEIWDIVREHHVCYDDTKSLPQKVAMLCELLDATIRERDVLRQQLAEALRDRDDFREQRNRAELSIVAMRCERDALKAELADAAKGGEG